MSYNIGDIVFALWAQDGYYYPGTIVQINDNQIYGIKFLDGDSTQVATQHMVPLQEALATMKIQGNWGNLGTFYPGRLVGIKEPFTIYYDDKTVSHRTKLRQLRGLRVVFSAPPIANENIQLKTKVVSLNCEGCNAPLDIKGAQRGQAIECEFCMTQHIVT